MPCNYFIHGNHPSHSSLVMLRWVSGLARSFSSGWAMEIKTYEHCGRSGSKSGWVFLSIAIQNTISFCWEVGTWHVQLLEGMQPCWALQGRLSVCTHMLPWSRTTQNTLQTMHLLQPSHSAFSVKSYLCYSYMGVTSSLGNEKQRKSNNDFRIHN